MTDIATTRRRTIMEDILHSLHITWQANPGCGIRAGQLGAGMAASMVPPGDDELRAAVADLVERQLIEAVSTEDPGLVPGKVYRITPRGRDFVQHRFPWDLVDSFSGRGGK